VSWSNSPTRWRWHLWCVHRIVCILSSYFLRLHQSGVKHRPSGKGAQSLRSQRIHAFTVRCQLTPTERCCHSPPPDRAIYMSVQPNAAATVPPFHHIPLAHPASCAPSAHSAVTSNLTQKSRQSCEHTPWTVRVGIAPFYPADAAIRISARMRRKQRTKADYPWWAHPPSCLIRLDLALPSNPY